MNGIKYKYKQNSIFGKTLQILKTTYINNNNLPSLLEPNTKPNTETNTKPNAETNAETNAESDNDSLYEMI